VQLDLFQGLGIGSQLHTWSGAIAASDHFLFSGFAASIAN